MRDTRYLASKGVGVGGVVVMDVEWVDEETEMMVVMARVPGVRYLWLGKRWWDGMGGWHVRIRTFFFFSSFLLFCFPLAPAFLVPFFRDAAVASFLA